MGNPHCVMFVDDDGVFKLSDRDFAALGREFEHHPFFPRRVNTEFILPISRHRLKMRVWERGSGETLGLRHRSVRGAGRGGADQSFRADRDAWSCAAAIWKSNGAQTAPMRITFS